MALRERRMKVNDEDFKKSKENVLYRKTEGTPDGACLCLLFRDYILVGKFRCVVCGGGGEKEFLTQHGGSQTYFYISMVPLPS